MPEAENEPFFGLCRKCGHAQRVRTARGSTFLRCRRADTDPRYVRYPPQPVLSCSGFEPDSPAG
jgi:hypothetical protein